MSTPYETVFKSFLKRIEDRDLPTYDEDDQTEMLIGWLNTAISYVDYNQFKIVNDLTEKDDDIQEFDADLTVAEIEALATLMVVAWYDPKINSLEHTLLIIGSKDEKWTSQKQHLEMLKNLQRDKRIEASKYFRNRGYKKNSYTGDE